MYKDIGFHAFSSDCKWDRSPALRYKVKRDNIIPSIVNVWLQRGESYTHCNLLPVHYSCSIVNEFIANQL